MKYKYHSKCSQCGVGWRANLRSELLKKMRTHMWRKHKDWMSNRIKKGLKKARTKASHNPRWFQPIMAGIFPPATLPTLVSDYRRMSPSERGFVKTAVRALTVPVGAEASAVAEVALRALDKAVEV